MVPEFPDQSHAPLPPGRNASPAAAAPTLAFAFSAQIELAAPIEQGVVDGGRRRFIAITGGSVRGPRFAGTVLAGGGDWQTNLPGGLTRVEARYFLRASDGTTIGVTNPGVRVATPEVTDMLAREDRVDPDAYYFRTTPRFEAPQGAHDWLTRAVFVARGVRLPGQVMIDFYVVL